MGHLIGLAHLGTESAAVSRLPVYLPAGLAEVLRRSMPWSTLIDEERILLRPLRSGDVVSLEAGLTVEAIEVPHRREHSETLAFIITGPDRRALFLPDIDSWDDGSVSLVTLLESVDVAWIDGTFYADGELGRDMSAIPHPRVVETMALLSDAPAELRGRVRFCHLNHTNPLLDPDSPQSLAVQAAGFLVAREGEVVGV
jgi:pyrroloquinoline quinone biosynthesis protein B